MLCEEGMIIVKVRSGLLVPQNTKQITPPETQNNIRKTDKFCTNCGMINHSVETSRKKKRL
jgi:hypothetical protein